MSRWSIKPTDFIDTIKEDANQHCKNIIADALQQVAVRSPVDKGSYRFSHIVSINTEDYSIKQGNGDPVQAAVGTIASFKFGDKAYIQNNTPYGDVIEYGGYPDPVKKGSWVKGKGYIKKSAGGFSRQAPNGVYTLAFQYIASKYK
ncbi:MULTISPECIES: hypothetical protein [Acinetobacter]|uniref:hypothetical protein n=1 Tax=Acinetobacter TaxID=469 RepID=UPI0002AECAE7|nr:MULTISPECIES: hypothetical protein [Acinetobacter]ELW84565.1 hypothetical protein ACINWC743_A0845 [Acinetobacter sp. WC-743]MBJ8426623.1 hypothetical protein [Acinetobacter bereziniae]MBJ8476126.1 hypothetical protein [Acinetobacter bereziniae]